MQRLGLLLLWLGALVGALVAFALGVNHFMPAGLHGASWWLALGVVKLTLLGSAGLMTAGAVLLRLAYRARDNSLAAGSSEPPPRIGTGE